MIPGSSSAQFFGAAGAAGGAGYEISRSLRFNSADSAYLSRTPASAGNRKTFSISYWFKPSTKTATQHFFFAGTGTSDNFRIRHDNNDIRVQIYDAGSNIGNLYMAPLFRDPSAWYHLLVVVDTTQATASDRIKGYINGELAPLVSGTYPSQNYDTFVNSTNPHFIGAQKGSSGAENFYDGYLADVYLIDGSALDPTSFGEFDTNGVWQPIDASGLTYGTNGFHLDFADNSSAAALGTDTSGNGNDWTVNNISVIQGTGNYNGTLAISLGSIVDYTLSFDGDLTTYALGNTSLPSAGSTGTITFTPTTAIPATSLRVYGDFGNTIYVKQEISVNGGSYQLGGGAYAGGWYDLSASITGGVISSLTTRTTRVSSAVFPPFFVAAIEVDGVILVDNRLSADNDSLRDSPTNGDTANDTGLGGELPGNYATLNPLNLTLVTLGNGNLEVSATGSTTYQNGAAGTIAVSSGKWYWEVTAGSNRDMFGIYDAAYPVRGFPGENTGEVGYNAGDGNIYPAGSAYGNSYTAGDLIGVALDLDNNKIWFAKNGTWQNSGSPTGGTNAAATGLTGIYAPGVRSNNTAASTTAIANFGQRAFAYTAPSGFKALCTANLPTPTIEDPSTVMDVALWSGTGASNSISGIDFSPDLVWVKNRNNTAFNLLFDTVRGATKGLSSNSTLDEASLTSTGSLTAFNSDGFTVSTDSSVNASGRTYVAWTWDAGSSTVSNTDGSISSSVRTNASAGFSIVSYTGTGSSATVGHGLGVAPQFIIVKNKDNNVYDWYVYHQNINTSNPGQYYLSLNLDIARNQTSQAWNNTAPTSSVFTVNGGGTSYGGQNHIAYCFAPVAGYSAFGSYTGNGSTDGPFVYTGFRPAFVLLKCSSTAGTYWTIHDNKRLGYNPDQDLLFPNASDAENSTSYMDFTSNGFKLRIVSSFANASGDTYIWAAFAESPFAYSRAR